MHPPCFDSQRQFDEWREAAEASRMVRRFGFCTDCTPALAQRMLHANRCIRPDVTFSFTQDLELEGWAPLRPDERARKLMKDTGFA